MSLANEETLLQEIIELLSEELDDNQKERVYYKLIKLFDQDNSLDLMDIESSDPFFDTMVEDYYEENNDTDESSDIDE